MKSRILLIDDDPAVLRALEILLLNLGFEVTTASNGFKGIRRFRENPPDLVITDIIMPDKEGIETIMEMRRDRRDAKIIAMSAGGPMDKRTLLSMASKLGADFVLEKPFDGGQLIEMVISALGSDSPTSGSAAPKSPPISGT